MLTCGQAQTFWGHFSIGPFNGGVDFQDNFEFVLAELLLYSTYRIFSVVFGSVFRILISLIVFCTLKKMSEHVKHIKIN